jgi:hypothetical protein
VEVSQVRKRLKMAIDGSRERAAKRRERVAEAQRAYEQFLTEIAIPMAKQLANAMKVEGYGFTVFTPGNGLRLAADRGRDDFIDLTLDSTGERPEVMARVSQQRGSRTLDEEVPVKRGAHPDEISEDEFLDFLLGALEPWFER